MAFDFSGMTPIVAFNFIVGTLFGLCFLYQVVFFLIGLFHGEVKLPPARKQHRYAFFIAAHNEEPVIANLVKSIKQQDYPSELIDIFVVADACTDNTAQAARDAGAIVYERNDLARKGKSWVMDYGFDRILSEYPDTYEAFFIFDADNLLSPNYVSIMNDAFDQGYLALTSYRNSKNFGSSWISAAYATWFLREARFLNYPRMKLHTNCAISGTGFLVSSKIIEENGGWPYHLLTEDIQFSTVCATKGWRIGYCDDAILYDEQPVTFSQSWRQRMRWAKGFYQVNAHCGMPLLRGCLRGPIRFSCYDMLMTVAPCTLLTIAAVFINLFCCVTMLSLPSFLARFMLRYVARSLLDMLTWSYGVMFAYGLLTVLAEWRRIPVSPLKKVMYLPFFPLFMFSYIPITLTALLVHVEWKPIRHTPVQNVRA